MLVANNKDIRSTAMTLHKQFFLSRKYLSCLFFSDFVTAQLNIVLLFVTDCNIITLPIKTKQFIQKEWTLTATIGRHLSL